MRNPAYFQGFKKTRAYFEGWYFKCISADRRHALAFIPAVHIDASGQKEAFVQVIEAVSGKTWYFSFPGESFRASKYALRIQIKDNTFTAAGLEVNLREKKECIRGDLRFSDIRPFPAGWLNTGIMGPFQLLPGLECYHGIVHLGHTLQGGIEINGQFLDFSGGSGYIEKDYGRSFPSSYVWLQGSHFERRDACLVFSRASIPFLGGEFPGFFAYLTDFNRLHARFATYTGARVEHFNADLKSGQLSVTLAGSAKRLSIRAQMRGGAALRAPVGGQMRREILESITATARVQLQDASGRCLFDEHTSQAGMELSL